MRFLKIFNKITFWKIEFWLAKSRISVTVWKTWKGSCHYTLPSYIRHHEHTVWRIYALQISTFSVFYTGYFSKRVIFLYGLFFYTGYFSKRVIFLYGLFYKTNKKTVFPCSHTLQKHSKSLGKLELFHSRGNTRHTGLCSHFTNLQFSQTSTRVSIRQRGKNKETAHETKSSVLCASITEQTTGKWSRLVILYNKYEKMRFKRFTEFSWGIFGALKKMNCVSWRVLWSIQIKQRHWLVILRWDS